MTEGNMKKLSLAEIKSLEGQGKLHMSHDAPEIDLPNDFWENAVVVERESRRSVHLRLDPEVFQYFKDTARGKGHITRMQDVLRAYVRAQKSRSL